MEIVVERKGQIHGEDVYIYTLKNDHGLQLTCTNFGCTVTEMITPDKNGTLENIVLGFDDVQDYLQDQPYFGSIIGRVAGRIANAEFTLDGAQYKLPANEGKHHLHGGIQGFDKKIWQSETIEEENKVGVRFSYTSPAGEEGYPGELEIFVTYYLTNDNQWEFFCRATTDQQT